MRRLWAPWCAVWLCWCWCGRAGAARFEKDMTITVAAGRSDCFYQDVAAGEVIDIDYQVIDASSGALEVSFQLAEPTGRVLAAAFRQPEGSQRHAAAAPGAYRLCFDNTFSTFGTKTVFFDLLVHGEDDAERDYDADDDREMELGGAQSYLMRVRDIAESVARVREHVAAAARLQDLHAAHEARDRNLAEGLCASVLRWALWQLALMVLVGVTQVIFVKSLFAEAPGGGAGGGPFARGPLAALARLLR